MSSLLSTFYYVISENQNVMVAPENNEVEEVKEIYPELNNYKHESVNESQIRYEQSIE